MSGGVFLYTLNKNIDFPFTNPVPYPTIILYGTILLEGEL
jgi:hypothetical protein